MACSTPHALSPDALSPHALSPCSLSPCTLSTDGLSENVLSCKKSSGVSPASLVNDVRNTVFDKLPLKISLCNACFSIYFLAH